MTTASTPPGIDVIVAVPSVDASAMERRQRHARLSRAGETEHDRVLAALAKLRAGTTIGLDFLRQPGVRNQREPELDEIRRGMRERAELVEACGGCASNQLVDQTTSGAAGARVYTRDAAPVDVAPFRESAHRRLMRAHAAAGDAAGAVGETTEWLPSRLGSEPADA